MSPEMIGSLGGALIGAAASIIVALIRRPNGPGTPSPRPKRAIGKLIIWVLVGVLIGGIGGGIGGFMLGSMKRWTESGLQSTTVPASAEIFNPNSILVTQYKTFRIFFVDDRTSIDASLVETGHTGAGYRISYRGISGDWAAGWEILLRATDMSRFKTLELYVKGGAGGEIPNIYLEDSNGVRKWVNLEDHLPITTDWQLARIPLADFHDHSGERIDLAHITKLQMVFEWERMEGTIYIDDVDLGK